MKRIINHPCSRMGGFTLMELTIVILIAAVLLSSALLYMPNQTIAVTQQAYQLAADLRYAQHLAQTTDQRTRVNFNSGTYSLTLMDGTTALKFAAGSSTVTLPTGVTVSTSGFASSVPSFVIFDGLGRPYTTNTVPYTLLASTATITLTSSGQTASVTLQPNTGKVN